MTIVGAIEEGLGQVPNIYIQNLLWMVLVQFF